MIQQPNKPEHDPLRALKYTVRTEALPNGDIAQEVVSESGDIRQTVLRSVVHLMDEQVRQALVKLGWTPPASLPAQSEGEQK